MTVSTAALPRFSDFTQCPLCVLVEGDGAGYATEHFNCNGTLWGFCFKHKMRWYVTRDMLGADDLSDDPSVLDEFQQVDAYYRHSYGDTKGDKQGKPLSRRAIAAAVAALHGRSSASGSDRPP